MLEFNACVACEVLLQLEVPLIVVLRSIRHQLRILRRERKNRFAEFTKVDAPLATLIQVSDKKVNVLPSEILKTKV
jgi:hypothetical protein